LVPLLTDGDAVFCSSLAIARHAESLGRGGPLFAKESDDAILRWVELSDRVMGAGRARMLAGLRVNGAAQREALPPFIPAVLAPMATTAALFHIALARDFEDLLTWRDALYARHRPGL
jgi:glutathione S-transferase